MTDENGVKDTNPPTLEPISEMNLSNEHGGIDVTMICNQICDSLKRKKGSSNIISTSTTDMEDEIERNSEIVSKEKLIELLELVSRTLSLVANPKNQDRLCIGMTGYPNVGKSSVINTFLNASKSTHGMLLTYLLLYKKCTCTMYVVDYFNLLSMV